MIENFEKFAENLKKTTDNYVFEDYLPKFDSIQNIEIDGRCPYEGYQRGWGIQYSGGSKHFNDLTKMIVADPAFSFAYEAAKDFTVVSSDNRMNQFLIMKYFVNRLQPGDVIEFGSYKGGNAIFLAILAKLFGYDSKIYACDTFEGMPETNQSIDIHKKGDFSDANYEFLQQYISKLNLDNLVLVKGLFEDTLRTPPMENLQFRFAHIDCDIESACDVSYTYVRDKMVKGGYVIFDDATVSSCIGATSFVETTLIQKEQKLSEQIWPHFVFRT
jgi:predicted O-methyltransferase YrrM